MKNTPKRPLQHAPMHDAKETGVEEGAASDRHQEPTDTSEVIEEIYDVTVDERGEAICTGYGSRLGCGSRLGRS